VLDQFEELFTLSDSQRRVELFFTQLSDLCDDKMPKNIQKYLNENKEKSQYLDEYSNYRLVFSLREDFLARLEECSVDIPSLRSNRYSLQAVTQEQAMDIILKPGQGIVSEEVAKAIVDKLSYTTAFIKSAECRFVEPSILSLF
jgi:predicted ATP-grasp superfamily ATP-dependent carboligase